MAAHPSRRPLPRAPQDEGGARGTSKAAPWQRNARFMPGDRVVNRRPDSRQFAQAGTVIGVETCFREDGQLERALIVIYDAGGAGLVPEGQLQLAEPGPFL